MRLLNAGFYAAFLALAACPAPRETGDAYIAPLNGQTAVPGEANSLDLVVHTFGVQLPPEYPLPTLVRVVDLESGDSVPGDVWMEGTSLHFTPRDGWRPNRRYAWTVNPIEDIPHGPETWVEGNLVGTAVFDTSDYLDMLGAVLRSDQEVCVVWSRQLTSDDTGDVRITIDDVELTLSDITLNLVGQNEWGVNFETLSNDPGVNVMCIDVPLERDGEAVPLREGSVLRVWWGERGPWRQEVQAVTIADKMGELRRLNELDEGEGGDTGSTGDTSEPVDTGPVDGGDTGGEDTGATDPEPDPGDTGETPPGEGSDGESGE